MNSVVLCLATTLATLGFFFLGVDAYYMAKLHHDYVYAGMVLIGFGFFLFILHIMKKALG